MGRRSIAALAILLAVGASAGKLAGQHTTSPQTLAVSVRRSVAIDPSPEVFLSLFRDEAANRVLTVTAQDGRPLTITGVRSESAHFTASVRPLVAEKSYEVTVKSPSGLPAGRYMEAFFLQTDRPGYEPRIGVNVFVKNDLYPSPETVDVGIVELARIPENQVVAVGHTTVRKRTGTFSVLSTTSDVPGLVPAVVGSGARQAVQIDVVADRAALKPGEVSGTIRITTDDPVHPVITIPVAAVVR